MTALVRVTSRNGGLGVVVVMVAGSHCWAEDAPVSLRPRNSDALTCCKWSLTEVVNSGAEKVNVGDKIINGNSRSVNSFSCKPELALRTRIFIFEHSSNSSRNSSNNSNNDNRYNIVVQLRDRSMERTETLSASRKSWWVRHLPL